MGRKIYMVSCLVIYTLIMALGFYKAIMSLYTFGVDSEVNLEEGVLFIIFGAVFLITTIIFMARKKVPAVLAFLFKFGLLFAFFACFFALIHFPTGLVCFLGVCAAFIWCICVFLRISVKKNGVSKGGPTYYRSVEAEITGEISDDTMELVEKMDMPNTIYKKGFDPEKLMDDYNKAVEEGKTAGFTPFLVSVDYSCLLDALFDDEDYTVSSVLDTDLSNGKQIIDGYYKEEIKSYEEFLSSNGKSITEFIGKYIPSDDEDEEDEDDEEELFRFERENDYVLFRVPTTKPWEIMAYFPFGGWNGCPPVNVMTAVCKYWYEEYGAVPAVMTHDTLQFILPKPVPKEKAHEVAKEFYGFCTDVCYADSGTLADVAEAIASSRYWFFWWD